MPGSADLYPELKSVRGFSEYSRQRSRGLGDIQRASVVWRAVAHCPSPLELRPLSVS